MFIYLVGLELEVFEPPSAMPVIIEDGAFIGSRAIIVEGVRIGKGAVIGTNVTITSSTPVIDVSGEKPIEHERNCLETLL